MKSIAAGSLRWNSNQYRGLNGLFAILKGTIREPEQAMFTQFAMKAMFLLIV